MLYKKSFYNIVEVQALNKPIMKSGSVFIPPDMPEVDPSIVQDVIKKIAAQDKESTLVVDGDATSNFDLEAELREHPDSLFIKCFAIEADVSNDNGDYFARDELIKATHTFVGVPLFTNHENTDITKAKGKVVHSWWDDGRNGIMIIARVDAAAYPQLARGIKEKYMLSTSMGTQVKYSLCSVCHNYSETPDGYCFAGDTPIVMHDFTVKPISEIKIGDKVIDADGRPTPVLNIFKHKGDNRALVMKSRGIAGELVCSKNHPFMIFTRGNYRFCPAEYLNDKQILFTPIPRIEQNNEFFKKFGFDHLSAENKNKLVRFIGYYAAEGSRVRRDGRIQALDINIHQFEETYRDDIIDICLSVFNKKPYIYYKTNTKALNLRLWEPNLCPVVYSMCPGIVHREKSKRFDESIFTLENKYIIELLTGFNDGDGHCSKDSQIVINSSCPGLIWQIYYLMTKIGSSPSMNRYVGCGGPLMRDKKFVSHRISLGTSQLKLLKYSGVKFAQAATKKIEYSKLTNIYTEDERFVRNTLYCIDEVDFNDLWYNIETGTHTYVANNVIVHNCAHVKEQKTRTISAKKIECQYHKNGNGKECPLCGSTKEEKKKFDVHDQKVFEHNYGLKFIENSIVSTPAFHNCGITEIIDPQSFFAKVADLQARLPGLLKAAQQQPVLCDDKKCVTLASAEHVESVNKALNILAESSEYIAKLSAVDFLKRNIQTLMKTAGQKEISDLNNALTLITNVSQSMLQQKDQIDLEFLSDLVEVLASLQTVTDELTEQGYGRIQSPNPQQQGEEQEQSSQSPDASQQTSPPPAAPMAPQPAGVGTAIGPLARVRKIDLQKVANLSKRKLNLWHALATKNS